MRRAFSLLILGTILISAGTASAQGQGNQQLKGTYAFSGEGTCLVSPTGGFNSDLTPTNPAGRFVFSFSVQGVRTFNGDGTGTMRARTVSITHSDVAAVAVLGGGGSTDIVSSFTYQVAPDGTVSILLSVPMTGTVLTGTRAGQTFTIDQLPLSGLVSKDRKTLTLASVTPTVEVVTYSNADVQHRICHRSRIHFQFD